MRLLSDTIFDMEYLGFTKLIIKKIIEKQTGLILISGPVGSGKTSTAVSLLDYYNTNFALHIITVEDPIEYIFTNKKSLIHQKEVNVDVSSFERSTVEVLREKSNILFLGEIVDYHSANLVLQASAIGQLVISTIHAGSSVETLERFTSFFNRNELDLVKKTLALFLNCIINQRLVYKDNKIKLLYEVLLSTQEVKGALFANNPFSTLTDALVRQRQVPIERQLEQINSF
jgi:twitching motility protein PilT